MGNTIRLTAAQAVVRYLGNQYVARDGREHRFFDAYWGIFGHGNVAGLGQAIKQDSQLRYHVPRNEQAMVHAAAAFAKSRNRMQAMVCTTSIGPGATNMVTGAAAATVNNLPVLLIPGDIFARRNVAPVLQQVESSASQDVSVNDCFKPVARYWDRLQRPDQVLTSLPEAMRVLTSPRETGAVVLAFPQDVQSEAFDYPLHFFEKRVWDIPRPRPDANQIERAAAAIKTATAPLIVAGGGVIYSGASEKLSSFSRELGIAVMETQAGKGALRYDHPFNLGGGGYTGTKGAIEIAAEADVVIGIGTRYNDFVTQSKTGFAHPNATFININVREFDAHKHSAIAVEADARTALEELTLALAGFKTSPAYQQRINGLNADWDRTVEQVYGAEHGPQVSQGEVIGAVNEAVGREGVMVAAAGSLPGDLHKLWRTQHDKQYHLEYGYSTMGYEIAGGLGVKMAFPEREVFIMVGDGSYLMMAQEIVTSVQEGIKLNVVLLNNHGYASIGALSRSVGCDAFGTQYRYRDQATGQLSGGNLPIDFAANAASMGAKAIFAENLGELRAALRRSVQSDVTTVTVIDTDPMHYIPGHGWWDVPIAEVSDMPAVQRAYEGYQPHRSRERYL